MRSTILSRSARGSTLSKLGVAAAAVLAIGVVGLDVARPLGGRRRAADPRPARAAIADRPPPPTSTSTALDRWTAKASIVTQETPTRVLEGRHPHPHAKGLDGNLSSCTPTVRRRR